MPTKRSRLPGLRSTRAKLDARTFTTIGEPALEIVAFAKKHRHGEPRPRPHHGPGARLVAGKVIHLASRPVTIVK